MPFKDPIKRRTYHKAYLAKWFPSRPGYRRKSNWKMRGLDSDRAEQVYNSTHVCGICGQIVAGAAKQIDHDHRTMRIRGVLCNDCNHALGLMHEDKEIMDRAREYLLRGCEGSTQL